MADILQSNLYEKLVRRIGYSVGLEDPVDRISKLVDQYVSELDINLALWKKLVKEEYGRKISDDLEATKWGGNRKSKKKLGAEDHFADFYSELNLISHKNNQVFPLYGIEVLSILKRMIKDEADYQIALKSIILLFFLESDGDIFLNSLMGNFEKVKVKENLITMFRTKREVYLKAFINPYARKKLAQIFKVQSGSGQDGIFTRKVSSDEIEIPEDYLSKILPSRKGWAIQLELFGTRLEERGEKLINFLKGMGIVNDECAAFYGYSELHRALSIDEKKAEIKTINRLDFFRDFFCSYYDVVLSASQTSIVKKDIYDLLMEIMTLYKSGNKVKGIIRHQLPFQVLFPVFYVVSALRNKQVIDLNDFIREEQKAPERKLDISHLRGGETEGALSLRV